MLGSQNRLSARSYFSGAPLALFLFFLSAILTDAAADDCAPVRLDQPGGTFEKIQVRDQKYGSCVVESVTQFMEALARRQGKGRLGFSSLEMLIRAAADPLTDSDGKNFDGFTYSNVLNLAFEVGLCTQEKVAQNLRLQSLDERKLLDAFGEWVNQTDQEARRAKESHYALDERYQNRQRLNPIDNVDMGMNRKYYQWESIGIEQAMVLNIQQFMVETRKKTGIPDSRFSKQRVIKPFVPLFERFSSMFPTLCPWYGREYMKNTGRLDTYTLDTQNGALSINGLSVGNPKFFTAKMNQHLLSPHPLPIPVSYCSQSLIDGKGAYGMLRTHLKDDIPVVDTPL